MTDMLEMPRVHECTVTDCGYNHDGCHAFAITIGQQNASCATFIDTSAKGGLDRVIAQVGACKRSDCQHNAELECHALGSWCPRTRRPRVIGVDRTSCLGRPLPSSR
ncbi:DUF1540 domain-containing protein [Micromonospora taraxaci]|uniref:DUF1540 domain-containing protein n=1 Tax=Micromonospora taraxaci TaxID=1316803 RepID=UPI0033E9921F